MNILYKTRHIPSFPQQSALAWLIQLSSPWPQNASFKPESSRIFVLTWLLSILACESELWKWQVDVVWKFFISRHILLHSNLNHFIPYHPSLRTKWFHSWYGSLYSDPTCRFGYFCWKDLASVKLDINCFDHPQWATTLIDVVWYGTSASYINNCELLYLGIWYR